MFFGNYSDVRFSNAAVTAYAVFAGLTPPQPLPREGFRISISNRRFRKNFIFRIDSLITTGAVAANGRGCKSDLTPNCGRQAKAISAEGRSMV